MVEDPPTPTRLGLAEIETVGGFVGAQTLPSQTVPDAQVAVTGVDRSTVVPFRAWTVLFPFVIA